jgi:DNA-binding transcriptional regulator YbjK
MSAKRVLGFLIAQPLIAVVIAAVVVGALLLFGTHKQTTPVTHRTEHVALSDEQQSQLGSQQYAQTLKQDRAEIVSSGPEYRQVQRVAKRIEAVAARDKPAFVW